MSTTRNDFKVSLKSIQQEALSPENTYQLTKEEANNLKVVLNTFLYLIDHLDDKEIIYGGCHFPAGTDIAPIHLENHPSGKLREKVLSDALFGTFIFCFNGLKDMGHEPIKIFCSKMTGYCVEDRTRKPFNYATSLILGLDEAEVAQAESSSRPVTRSIPAQSTGGFGLFRGYAQTLLQFFNKSIEGLGVTTLLEFNLNYPQSQTQNSIRALNSHYPFFNSHQVDSPTIPDDNLENEMKSEHKLQ
ncbi:MAG: hypothetical protein P4M14_12330 [Gammaproteobacteria bacterium]|nr:hypothetical protein [Gammaproteobacteria bacterium]